jgi:hypothetical protein
MSACDSDGGFHGLCSPGGEEDALEPASAEPGQPMSQPRRRRVGAPVTALDEQLVCGIARHVGVGVPVVPEVQCSDLLRIGPAHHLAPSGKRTICLNWPVPSNRAGR